MAIKSRMDRARAAYLMDVLDEMSWRSAQIIAENDGLPEGWRSVTGMRGPQPRRAVTLRIEEDVIRYFKGTGRGWHDRMNRVLKAFVEAEKAGLIQSAEYFAHHDQVEQWQDRLAPRIGDNFNAEAGESARPERLSEGRVGPAASRSALRALRRELE